MFRPGIYDRGHHEQRHICHGEAVLQMGPPAHSKELCVCPPYPYPTAHGTGSFVSSHPGDHVSWIDRQSSIKTFERPTEPHTALATLETVNPPLQRYPAF